MPMMTITDEGKAYTSMAYIYLGLSVYLLFLSLLTALLPFTG